MVESKQEGVVTMCICQGMFLIGRLMPDRKKLLQPRAFNVFQEEEKDEHGEVKMVEKIGMRGLPGIPPFCYIGEAITYPVTTNTMNILKLYEQVTTPIAPVEVKLGNPIGEVGRPDNKFMGPRETDPKLN